jgi:hypothetical protein
MNVGVMKDYKLRDLRAPRLVVMKKKETELIHGGGPA